MAGAKPAVSRRSIDAKEHITTELRSLRASFSAVLYGTPTEVAAALRSIVSLCNGSHGQEACSTILELDGAMPLVRLLGEADVSSAVLLNCLSVLRHIAAHGEDGPRTLCERGIVQPLMTVIASEDADVQASAALLAASLCSAEDIAALLLDAGLLAAAKRLARGLPAVRGGAGHMFAAVCGTPANRAKVVAEGVLSELLDIIYPRRLPNDGEPYDSDDDAAKQPPAKPPPPPVLGPNGRPVLRRRRSSLLPPKPPKGKVDDGKRAALEALVLLCSQGDFLDALQRVPNLFELLFELCDSPDEQVCQMAHRVAAHWEADRFGFCWNICSACKALAQRLMLPDHDPVRSPAKAISPTIRRLAGSDGGAGGSGTAVAEADRDRSDFGEELTTVQKRLQEFMKDADVELKRLLEWQERLDEKLALAERHRASHASRCGRGPQRTESRRRHAGMARDMERLARELRETLVDLRLGSHMLLRHGNVLLDAEEQVQLQITRLNELKSYVSDGKAVEVTKRWSKHSSRLCGDALVKLATRLEMHVRGSIGERAASEAHLARAGRLLEALASLARESDQMLWDNPARPAPSHTPAELARGGVPRPRTCSGLPQPSRSPGAAPDAPALPPSIEMRGGAVAAPPPSPPLPRFAVVDGFLSWPECEPPRSPGRMRVGERADAAGRGRSLPARSVARLHAGPTRAASLVSLKPAGGFPSGAPKDRSLPASASATSLRPIGFGASMFKSASLSSLFAPPPGARALQNLRASKFALVKPRLISRGMGVAAELADEVTQQEAAEALSAEGITALAADIRQGKLKLSRLRAIFSAIDADGSGSVDAPEVEALLQSTGIEVQAEELHALVQELDVDGNGTLDFVELLELFRKISARAQEATREQMDVGVGVRVSGGPLLASLLAEARKPRPRTPSCADLQVERRLARARRTSPRHKPTGPLVRESSGGGPPGGLLVLPPKRDTRSAVHARRSALSEAMGTGEAFDAALVAHAFTEPAEGLDPTQDGSAAMLPVDTLQRIYAWARISSVTDAGHFDGRMEHGRPHIDGQAWIKAIQRWSQHLKLPPPITPLGGTVCLRGLRRCHPAGRQPPLSGWDTLRLLEMFGVSALDDMPRADNALLARLPLVQMWPSVASPAAMAPPQARTIRRMGSSTASSKVLMGGASAGGRPVKA
jgi:hypothetical protein